MSAGDFVSAIYETDAGNFCNVRLQPETLAMTINASANGEGAGPINQEASAIARKGKRGIGVGCRLVGIDFAGAPPSGYTSDILYVPVLTPALFASASLGSPVSYLAASGVIVSKIAEDVG